MQGGRITALGSSGKVRIPAGATRIDGRGQFLMPGLAEMHGHLFHDLHGEQPRGVVGDTARALFRLVMYVSNGVTTLRNMDNAFHPNNAPSMWVARWL